MCFANLSFHAIIKKRPKKNLHNQPTPHQVDREHAEDCRHNNDPHKVQSQSPCDSREREHPGDGDQVREREYGDSKILEEEGEKREREKRAREEHHRGYEKERRIVERIDPRGYRGETHRDPGKH